MKEIPYFEDVESFIKEVELYPEIWNLRCDAYCDKNKRKSAWLRVCQATCVGFDEKNDKEKEDICNTLTKKWRNIKDTYLKTLKKNRAGLRCRTYVYAKQLNYVKQAYLDPETGSNSNINQPASIENSCDNDFGEPVYAELLQNQDEDSHPSSPPNKTIKRECSSEPEPHQIPEEPSIKLEQPVLTSFENTTTTPGPIQPMEQSFTNCTVQPIVSANQAFFNSLLPIVDGFTDSEIVDFRLDVLSTIKRMQNARPKQHNTQ